MNQMPYRLRLGPTAEPPMTVDRMFAMRPSELIELALRDLRACLDDPSYVVSMGVWHEPAGVVARDGDDVLVTFQKQRHGLWSTTTYARGCALSDEVCVVCMAGAVLAKSLGYSARQPYTPPVTHPSREEMRLHGLMEALDNARQGELQRALLLLGFPRPASVPAFMPVREIDNDEDGFFYDMRRVVETLRRSGL